MPVSKCSLDYILANLFPILWRRKGIVFAGLLILWGKVALNSLRESRHPRRVLAYWLFGLGLLVLLTVLGVKLPNEGG